MKCWKNVLFSKDSKGRQYGRCELCGLPQSSIAHIETGEASSSISTDTKALLALGKHLCPEELA